MSLRKKFFAWILKQGESYNLRIYEHYKRRLFAGLKGLVVEIGPGTGINFNYLPKGTQWLGVEPNAAFHKGLLQQGVEKGIDAKLVSGDATHIPIADNSADAVVCTLVLCSVNDPVKAVAEIKRVLKPGGKLVLIEHVAAPRGTGLRIAQNLSNPFNRLMADGCNCNRETWTTIEQGGFSEVSLSHERIKGTMKLHAPHIMGYAIK